jgi:hypothetical protein
MEGGLFASITPTVIFEVRSSSSGMKTEKMNKEK